MVNLFNIISSGLSNRIEERRFKSFTKIVEEDNYEKAKIYLQENNIDINKVYYSTDKYGEYCKLSPILVAVQKENDKMVDLLLSNMQNCNIKNVRVFIGDTVEMPQFKDNVSDYDTSPAFFDLLDKVYSDSTYIDSADKPKDWSGDDRYYKRLNILVSILSFIKNKDIEKFNETINIIKDEYITCKDLSRNLVEFISVQLTKKERDVLLENIDDKNKASKKSKKI